MFLQPDKKITKKESSAIRLPAAMNGFRGFAKNRKLNAQPVKTKIFWS